MTIKKQKEEKPTRTKRIKRRQQLIRDAGNMLENRKWMDEKQHT